MFEQLGRPKKGVVGAWFGYPTLKPYNVIHDGDWHEDLALLRTLWHVGKSYHPTSNRNYVVQDSRWWFVCKTFPNSEPRMSAFFALDRSSSSRQLAIIILP